MAEKFDRRFVPRKKYIDFSSDIQRLTDNPPPPPEWITRIPQLDKKQVPDELILWCFADYDEHPKIIFRALKEAGISYPEDYEVWSAIDAAIYHPTVKGHPIRSIGNDDALLRVGDIRALSVEELEQIDQIRSYPYAALILKKLFGDKE